MPHPRVLRVGARATTARERVEIRGDPPQNAADPRLVDGHELGLEIVVRAQVDDDRLAALQLVEPGEALAQRRHLLRHPRAWHGLGLYWLRSSSVA